MFRKPWNAHRLLRWLAAECLFVCLGMDLWTYRYHPGYFLISISLTLLVLLAGYVGFAKPQSSGTSR